MVYYVNRTDSGAAKPRPPANLRRIPAGAEGAPEEARERIFMPSNRQNDRFSRNGAHNRNKNTRPSPRPGTSGRRGEPREEIRSAENESAVEGRNPVIEALRAGQPLDKIFLAQNAEGRDDPVAAKIVGLAREAGVPVVRCDRRMLDRMSVTGAHQGVIAQAAAASYAEISDLLESSRKKGRAPLIVVCDSINDPGNLGAIIRSAEIAGADGVIIPRRRSAGLTPSVYKASAGALSYLPVARAANVASALKELKEAGLWIFGADAAGEVLYYEADMTLPMALVIGSEGDGISRLAAESCDFLLKIPMLGRINSLNASAAAAVLLFESLRQRGV